MTQSESDRFIVDDTVFNPNPMYASGSVLLLSNCDGNCFKFSQTQTSEIAVDRGIPSVLKEVGFRMIYAVIIQRDIMNFV